MQSTNSEYGSPYLAVCHVTFTFKQRWNMYGQYAFKAINIEEMCQRHLYVPNFLLSVGGAMTITVY